MENMMSKNSKSITLSWIPVKYHKVTGATRIDRGIVPIIIDGQMPDDEQEVLVTDGKRVWMDIALMYNSNVYYLDSGHEWGNDVIAWMPKPEPYKSEGKGNDK